MIETQRYGVNGHYLHQKVEGIGDDCEVKEYGRGYQDGEYGAFGLVLYPYGYQHETQSLLVIYLKGRWVPTTTETGTGIKLTPTNDIGAYAKDRAGDSWATFLSTDWITCDYHQCGKKINWGWRKGKFGEELTYYCSEHIEKED